VAGSLPIALLGWLGYRGAVMRESLLGVSLSDMEEVMAGFGEKSR